jgi:large subunit ribosomal protein L25
MITKVVVNGTARTETGKKSSKATRRAGEVPVVMYGPNELYHFTAKVTDFKQLIYTPDFKIAEVNLDGKKYDCIIKTKQFHPISEGLLHVDLLIMTPGNALKVNIPLRFKGASPGVKVGGKFLQQVRTIKVKTTPESIVDQLIVDISTLELGQSVRVRDIEIPAGVEIMSAGATPVATVEVPRALRGKQNQG